MGTRFSVPADRAVARSERPVVTVPVRTEEAAAVHKPRGGSAAVATAVRVPLVWEQVVGITRVPEAAGGTAEVPVGAIAMAAAPAAGVVVQAMLRR